jgi:AcrR family transcriptional regulator
MRARTVKIADERRRELLDIALALFSEHGYDDTSVQDITDAAGLAKGTFYHYFATKEDLLDELAHRVAERVAGEVESSVVALEGDPVARLRALVGASAPWRLIDARDPSRAWLSVTHAEQNIDLRERVTESYLGRLRPLFAEVITEGAASGAFAVSDPVPTSDVVLSMWRGMSDHLAELLLSAGDGPDDVRVVLAHLRAIEQALERLLGMEPGSLALHDYDALGAELPSIAGHPGRRPDATEVIRDE